MTGSDLYIRYLEGHSDYKRKISKVEIIRGLSPREIQPLVGGPEQAHLVHADQLGERVAVGAQQGGAGLR